MPGVNVMPRIMEIVTPLGSDVLRFHRMHAREEMSLGSQSVASPVTGSDGEVVAALAAVLRSGRGDLRRLGPAVRSAAIAASRSLQERERLGGPLAAHTH